jgi:hypothetical protein
MLRAVLALFAIGLVLQWLYPLRQSEAYHAFADTRPWLGIPNAADVLSNVPIFLAGLANLVWVRRQADGGGRLRSGLLVTGLGLTLTGIGSAYFHYAPGDATLVWDRLPLAVVFAGVLLTAWSCAAVTPPNLFQVALLVFASLGSVAFWVYLGSLWPYGILQFGGLAVLFYLVLGRRLQGAGGWWCVIVFYALAKAFEHFDHEIWMLTGNVVSGHTLKHLMSAAAGLVFIWIGSAARRASRAAGVAATAASAVRSTRT